ncbi:thioredoxin domain-containing protein 3 homolog isoform X2 [Exaiptasia diaphana]|uniref:guanylate kinase n=1 Tax=Exaiptasia diaphana TaxID=2652724 RepID=A0A913WRY7_EXADI|nr:thioredoxin domain-containing protein 3 homolog isoform X2 [Exaiptasia diaphana]
MSVRAGLRNPYTAESEPTRRKSRVSRLLEVPSPVVDSSDDEPFFDDDGMFVVPRFDPSRVKKKKRTLELANRKEVKFALKSFKSLLSTSRTNPSSLRRVRFGIMTEVKTQEQWDELITKEGMIVVDAFSAWCGPCKAIISSFKRLKNEIGDDLLHFAVAETDTIDSLEKYRMRSQPTFLFYAGGILVNVVRGCHCPLLLKTIRQELEKEHKVLEGHCERERFIDTEVNKVADEEIEEKKPDEEEEDEEEEIVHLPKQVTLAIIKPDAVKAGLVDDIIKKVEDMGIEILKKEERTLTKEEAAEFYKQHEDSEHFEQLIEFMSSGPLMTLALSKAGDTPEAVEGVIDSFRELIGPKDVNIAKEEAPESLRAIYGTDTVMNAVHGCDSSESAARELAFFFPDFAAPTVLGKRKKRRLQRTLALIRPDALRTRKESIINKIQESGFTIAMSKEMQLTKEQAENFYSEHKDTEYFDQLVNNMISGPMMALCLAREDAVEGWRELLGPKEVEVAKEEAPESLRAQFQVEDSPINPLHGSDSPSAAEKEIGQFFPMQSTVAVIKPEVEPDQRELIKQRIKEAGFSIQAQKEITLTKELASQFYHEHEGKEFFSDLTDYMASGKTMFLVLSKEDAVSGWRAMMGPSDPTEAKEAAPETLRAQFGVDKLKNVVHGSSNPDKAVEVIKEFFPEVELNPDGTVKVPEKKKKDVAAPEEKKEDLSTALGLEDGRVPDESLTASSELDDGHSAKCARLNIQADGDMKGAWAAKDNDENQWLQVNLGQFTRVSKIATQGQNGESSNHVKTYGVMYSGDGETFMDYAVDKVFEANTDQETVVCNELVPPLISQYIRIVPKTWNDNIALRIEVYGIDAASFSKLFDVPDDSITASSVLDDNHNACRSKLNSAVDGDQMAGWSAKDIDENQWIQIDIGNPSEITKVSTQGKGGESTHHVTSYLLSFSSDGENFQVYQEAGQDKVFDGNNDQETIVSHWLANPPVARYVRLHPKTWNENIALRVGFSGKGTIKKSKPLVLCGPSGCGKSTLLRKLFTDYPKQFGFSVSHTTRAPRPGEVNGKDYHFTDRETMTNSISSGNFIESTEYNMNLYGTSKKAVQDVMDSGRVCILDIDMQGVKNMKKTDIECLYVFTKPPSLEELERRLRSRGTETDDSVKRRLKIAEDELAYAKEPGSYDYIIINDDLNQAYKDFKNVISKELIQLS